MTAYKIDSWKSRLGKHSLSSLCIASPSDRAHDSLERQKLLSSLHCHQIYKTHNTSVILYFLSGNKCHSDFSQSCTAKQFEKFREKSSSSFRSAAPPAAIIDSIWKQRPTTTFLVQYRRWPDCSNKDQNGGLASTMTCLEKLNSCVVVISHYPLYGFKCTTLELTHGGYREQLHPSQQHLTFR